jgi:hypothetical protein
MALNFVDCRSVLKDSFPIPLQEVWEASSRFYVREHRFSGWRNKGLLYRTFERQNTRRHRANWLETFSLPSVALLAKLFSFLWKNSIISL